MKRIIILFISFSFLFAGNASIKFDGVNDYVDCGNDESLNITDAITIEAWVYCQNYRNTIVGKIAPRANKKGYTLSINANAKPFIRIGNNSSYYTAKGSVIDTGRWYHIVGTHDSNLPSDNLKIFINGVLSGSTNAAVSIANTTESVKIGIRLAADYFHGFIYEVRIYNRALTAEEIQWNYNHPLNPIKKGLVLWIKGDKFKGDTLYDLSGYGNNGIMKNGAKPFVDYPANWIGVRQK